MNEVVEDLKIVRNLIKEDSDFLREKYLSNQEIYENFLKKFTDFFSKRRMFQLRIPDQYDKIIGLVIEGNKKYINEENENNFDILSREIKMSSEYRVSINDFRDFEESIAIFKQSVGLNLTDRKMSYPDLIDTLENVGEKYLEVRNAKSIKKFTKDIYKIISKSRRLVYAKELVENSLDDETRKVFELCNNEEFLLFANYSFNVYRKCDGNFKEDVKDIINLSKVLNTIELRKKDSKEDTYKKLASFTNKSLIKYEKDKEKYDSFALKKVKKLSKKQK